MRPLLLSISALLFLATALPGAGAAQAADPNTPVSSEVEAAVAQPAPQEAGAGTALPERAAPPRTMRAYWHVFAAFAVAWILLFGYALAIGRRFARLEDEVRRLGGAAE